MNLIFLSITGGLAFRRPVFSSHFSTRAFLSALGVAAVGLLPVASSFADTYTLNGVGAVNWTTGWTGGGSVYPQLAGDVAQKTSGASAALTQNVGAPVTVGTFLVGGNSSSAWTITPTSEIILNDGGAGAAAVTVNSSIVSGRIVFAAGTLTLADNLLITNTTSTAGNAIQINSTLGGAGNITINNSSNSVTAGNVFFSTGVNTFAGNVAIDKGAVTFNNKASFGNVASNLITLGSLGGGGATLVVTSSTGTGAVNAISNNIAVASGSGGTLTLGSTSVASTGGANYSGSVTLNGDLTTLSAFTGTGILIFSGALTGTGNLAVTGTSTRFQGVNTYTGNTVISASAASFASGSELRFNLANGGVTNGLSGSGTVALDGLFRLDISGVSDVTGSWNLVNVTTLTETFNPSTFGLAFVGEATFTSGNGGVTYTSGGWTFDTATGNLSLQAIPEPGTLCLLGFAAGTALTLYRRRIASVLT